MIRGLFTAASGMLAGERKQEIISNNLANINTVGYKKDDGVMRSFPEMLLYAVNDHTGSGPQAIGPGTPTMGSVGTGAFLEEVLTRFTPGMLKQSTNKLARAIIDNPANPDTQKSFFLVTDRNQQSYVSRDGDFHTDTDGFLVNNGGHYWQAVETYEDPITGESRARIVPNSRIQVGQNGTDLVIGTLDEEGVFTPDDTGTLSLGFVDVENVNKLKAVGNGAFQFDETNLFGGTGEIREGFVEGSNVDLTAAVTDMISVMRSYEANQRVIRTLDSTLDKAVNSLGRL
jgi:flagellar basal-body rod protein FlgF